jgi:signal transduction histidine kinase
MKQETIINEVRQVVRLLPGGLVSTKIFLWTYPISLFLAVATTPTEINGAKELLLWILLGFLAHSAMYPFVYYGRTAKKLSEQVLLVILMGIARGSVIGLFAPLMGLEDELSAPVRVLNSALAVFYWMQAGAIIMQHGFTFREKVKEFLTEILEKGIIDLPQIAKKSTSELVIIIGALQEKIVDTVGHSPSRSEIHQASADFDSLINEHIRPLSQSRWRDGDLLWIKAGFFAVMRRTLTNQRIPAIPVIVLTFPFSFIVQTSRIGFWATVLVQGTWTSLVVILDRVLIPRMKSDQGYWKMNLVFLASLITVIYPITFFTQYLTPFDSPSSMSSMIQGYVLSAVSQIALFIIGAMLFSIQNDQGFAFQFLSDIIKKGELETLLKHTQSGNTDSQFAQYVHAEVQSQLLACKLLLLKAAESDFELFPPDITAQIVERMEKIKQPYRRPAAKVTSKRLPEIAQSWQGLAEIEYELIPEFSEFHSQSEITSQLIEEAVVNAIRHGKASKISIKATASNSSISVFVRDNGSMQMAQASSGLGTILLNTFTQSWSLEREGNQSLLTFSVPSGKRNSQ